MRQFASTPIETAIETWVHPAIVDTPDRRRHAAFIFSRLAGSLVALAGLPVALALWGVPSGRDAAALLWLATPLFLVLLVSRTGRFALAHALSSVAFAGLLSYLAWWTGGLASFAIVGLALVLVEAALSGSRALFTGAAVAVGGAALGLHLAGQADLLPHPAPLAAGSVLMLVGAVMTGFHAWGIAAGLTRLHGEAEAAILRERHESHLIAEHATDLVSRHTRSGLILEVSPAASTVAGTPGAALVGDGLFARVHVADRPAFLRAFSLAAEGREETVTYRLRVDEPGGEVFHWVETRCRRSRERSEDGAVEIVAVTRDVDARKRAEDDLRTAETRLAEAAEAKARLLGELAQDLRAPLDAILGFSELIAEESARRPGSGGTGEYAKLIAVAGRQMLERVAALADVPLEAPRLPIVTPFPARRDEPSDAARPLRMARHA